MNTDEYYETERDMEGTFLYHLTQTSKDRGVAKALMGRVDVWGLQAFPEREEIPAPVEMQGLKVALDQRVYQVNLCVSEYSQSYSNEKETNMHYISI